jgi:hypothetical protein
MRLPDSPGARFGLWAAAAVVALLLLFAVVNRLTPTPKGPASSSYATSARGAAAYAELLEAAGRRVTRVRRPLAQRAPAPGTTLVVLGAARLAPEEAAAIGSFLQDGGRLVVAGTGELDWLEAAVGGPAPGARQAARGSAEPIGTEPETAEVGEVRTAEGGELTALDGATPILGGQGSVLAAVQDVGSQGRVIVLADPSPLQNRALAEADNAAFALALAGPGGRPVAFLETVHGYGATGLSALPASAKWALVLLGLALVAFVWSRARRLGPVERDEHEELPPPRAAYVDALAATLEQTKRPDAVGERLASEARARLARRAALHGQGGDAQLREAAARFGLTDEETRAVVDGVRGADGALAAGRALARLGERGAVS